VWMGVPVITLRGRSLVARQGASLLSAHGCSEWVAQSEEQYVRIALQLAQSDDALRLHHQALLDKRQSSVLFDVAGFASDWLDALEASLVSHRR
jgi:protein O-GlcNAc transferase